MTDISDARKKATYLTTRRDWFLRICGALGIQPLALKTALRHLPRFIADYRRYKRLVTDTAFQPTFRLVYPTLTDYSGAAGAVSSHVFFQDLWAARKIFQARPASHVDVGSRIDGFVAHLLTFMPVTVVDIRPMPRVVEGLVFMKQDATTMPGFSDSSVPSLSSLHAIEHFGLGRYGDTIDPDACFVGMKSLARVLAPGGRLYFSVPIGRERVEFNAHRVFDPVRVIDTFDGLQLVSFAVETDQGDFLLEADPQDFRSARYACGMFELTK